MTDIAALIKNSGIRIAPDDHPKSRDGWLQFNCPHCCHSDSDKFHMGLNIHFGYVNCWKCGYHDLAGTLEVLLGLSRTESARIATRSRGAQIPVSQKERPHRRNCAIPARIGPLKRAHERYLQNRDFDPDEIHRFWRIGGIGMSDRCAWTIFIPILLHGKLVSWTTRSIDPDTKMRYISAKPEEEVLHHKTLLYGEDYCRHSIIVHEGPTDAWRTGPGAVATFGQNYSREQIERISKYPRRYICFDSSKDAQNRAGRLADELSIFDGQTFRIELDAEDPATADPKETSRLRKVALGV